MLELWKKQFSWDAFSMKHAEPLTFYKSQWQTNGNPNIIYLLYRWLVTAYFLGTWLFSVIDPKDLDKSSEFRIKWLIYFTNWGYTACLFQSLLCSVSLTYWIIRVNKNEDGKNQHNMWITSIYKIYWISNTIATDYAFGVSLFYWVILYDGSKMELDAQNIFVHGINSVVMFVELCIVMHPILFVHFYLPVLCAVTYTIFSLVYFLAGGTSREEDPYIYNVVDWRKPEKAAAVCSAVLIYMTILHGFSCCIYRLRVYIYKKVTSKQFSSKTHQQESQNEFDNILPSV